MAMSNSYCPQPRYCAEYQERAKADKQELFTIDLNDRFSIEMMGATTPDKAKRIWAILQEPDPMDQVNQ